MILLPTKSCLAKLVFNTLRKTEEALGDNSPPPESSMMLYREEKRSNKVSLKFHKGRAFVFHKKLTVSFCVMWVKLLSKKAYEILKTSSSALVKLQTAAIHPWHPPTSKQLLPNSCIQLTVINTFTSQICHLWHLLMYLPPYYSTYYSIHNLFCHSMTATKSFTTCLVHCCARSLCWASAAVCILAHNRRALTDI